MEQSSEKEDQSKSTKADCLPPSFKKEYFPDKDMPNLSKDYSCIGFDADHCLVKYNIKTLNSLLTMLHLWDMHECAGYPEEVCKFDCN